MTVTLIAAPSMNWFLPRRRSLADKLPVEIIDGIIDLVLISSTKENDSRNSLLQLSLVCWPWSWRAQRRLFQDVSLGGNEKNSLPSIISLLSAIHPHSEKGRFLGASVRSLSIRIAESEGDRALYVMAKALPWCPQVQCLDISYLTYQPISQLTIDTLKLCSSIRRLRLMCMNRLQAFQLMHCWPAIEYLSIRGDPRDSSLRSFTDTTEVFPVLPRYRLAEFRLAKRGLDEDLEGILASSAGSLEVLQLHTLPNDHSIFCRIMELHGPYLRSLRIDVRRLRYGEQPLRHCTKLEELICIGYAIPEQRHLDALPSKRIQHFSCKRPTQEILQWMCTLPSLRFVSMHYADYSFTHKDFDPLGCAELLESRGVKFLLTPNEEPYLKEDFAYPTKFPRYFT